MAASTWDASELVQLAADLDKTPVEIVKGLRGIMAKAAVNMKKQLRAEMQASPHFKGAAHRISYDMTTVGDDTVVVDVGPSHGEGDPGSLGNIAYFGTSKGGGTVPDPIGALEAEVSAAEVWIGRLLAGEL